METPAARKRKADDGWHDKENIKKARIECLDLFQTLPLEIIEVIIFSFEDPLAIVLLSLTSRNWLNFVQTISNKIWHAIYLATRQRFEMNIDGTTLDKLLKSAYGFAGPHHTAIFEWDFEVWDHPLTTNCLEIQKDLTAEDEHLAQFPAQYFADETTYSHSMGVKEVKHEIYNEALDYKRLALKTELKFRQFDLWKDFKPTNEAVSNENCSCMKEPTELALYDANDQELSIRSNLDLHLDEDNFCTGTPVLKQKEFKYGWDNDSTSDQEDDTSAAETDNNLPSSTSNTNVSINDIKMEPAEKYSGDEKLDLENEDEQSESDDSEEPENIEYDGYISVEKRDQLLEDIAAAPQYALKAFIQVLSALILGHCPAPSCHDSALITTAKYEHTIVRTGDVLDDVINQIKHGVTLNLTDTISTMTCALQKLRMTDLLFLKQGTEEKYPYLTAVYSVLEVEENVPLPFYIGDANWAFNLDSSVVNPWTSYFQADFATDEDFDEMPDWLSVRHSVHRLMRKAGTTCATPNTTEFAVLTLCDYIRKTLSAIVEENSGKDSIEVTSRDVLKAIEKSAGPNKLSRAYTYNTDYYDENPIVLNSDSEAYSYESSSDSDWVDEPITDLDEGTIVSVDQEDIRTDDPLHSTVQESLKKCVVHAQYDAKEDSERDIGEDSSDDDDDESVEERIYRTMINYWDTVADNAPGNDDKTAYYMPKTLTEEAMHYTAQELSEYDQMAKLFIEKYEEDVPFHDMPADQRQKMLELRRQTNQMIRDQCEEEFHQEVKTKYDRMNFNSDHCDLSIRSDADQCKTMIIDLIDYKTIAQTIQTASQIIQSSATLKSIKIMNVDCCVEGTEDLIAPLFGDIAASPSISSLVIFNCRFKSLILLTDLLRKKSFTRFHMMFPVGFKDHNVEHDDEFLNALKNQQSLKDLLLPIDADESKKKYLDAISALVSQLATLHIWYLGAKSFDKLVPALTDVFKQPHQLELVVHLFLYMLRINGPQLVLTMEKLNVKYRIQQH